jgi:hypothetical protein
MNGLFGSAPLAPEAWLAALLVSIVVVPAISLEKRARRARRLSCCLRRATGRERRRA